MKTLQKKETRTDLTVNKNNHSSRAIYTYIFFELDRNPDPTSLRVALTPVAELSIFVSYLRADI